MPYRVLLTQDAVNDLEELDSWIATNDSPERADYVLDRISEAFQKLTELPERGTHPKELSALGIREFREVFYKPYRNYRPSWACWVSLPSNRWPDS
ncbi:MAG: type II toxin-antitoxin system RelE/ParE family toxin [Gammaproteobacteria bacterium]|nr:type II toxin-antitoxin system RelE/ParE family toxin [Gammaproteobacteria bacterium]